MFSLQLVIIHGDGFIHTTIGKDLMKLLIKKKKLIKKIYNDIIKIRNLKVILIIKINKIKKRNRIKTLN